MHGPLPDSRQRLLLQAALRGDSVASSAFQIWERQLDLDTLEEASIRLIPLLSTNLSRLGIDCSEAGRMRGLRRYHWSRNQLHLRHCRDVAQLLGTRGIEVMAIKGIPLALNYYESIGLRPMSDIDLLVPTALAEQAVATLEASGYSAKPGEAPRYRGGRLDTKEHHGAGFVDASGRECDLHWHMLNDCLSDDDDVAIWERARRHEIQAAEVFFPGPEDLLLHVCVHGMRANPLPPVRWVADAAVVLRATRLNWEIVLLEAERRLLGPTLLLALRTLRSVVGAGIVPPTVIERLAALKTPPYVHTELELRQRSVDYRYTLAGRLCELHRRHPSNGSLGLLRAVPGFLMDIWELDSPVQLPSALWQRLASTHGRRSKP